MSDVFRKRFSDIPELMTWSMDASMCLEDVRPHMKFILGILFSSLPEKVVQFRNPLVRLPYKFRFDLEINKTKGSTAIYYHNIFSLIEELSAAYNMQKKLMKSKFRKLVQDKYYSISFQWLFLL